MELAWCPVFMLYMVTDGLEQTTDMMAASAGSAYVFRLPIIIFLRNYFPFFSRYIYSTLRVSNALTQMCILGPNELMMSLAVL